LIAAREASLPVIMVRRPPVEPGETVTSVDAALGWLDAYLMRAAATARDTYSP
jgi:precorrin-6A/cobalt-precorrin-6A reductase